MTKEPIHRFRLSILLPLEGMRSILAAAMYKLTLLCLVIHKGRSFQPSSRFHSVLGSSSSSSRGAIPGYSVSNNNNRKRMELSSSSTAAPSASKETCYSWENLQQKIGETAVGASLNTESSLRTLGKGSAHVQNKLRMFASSEEPAITLFRDHAGWYVSLAIVCHFFSHSFIVDFIITSPFS